MNEYGAVRSIERGSDIGRKVLRGLGKVLFGTCLLFSPEISIGQTTETLSTEGPGRGRREVERIMPQYFSDGLEVSAVGGFVLPKKVIEYIKNKKYILHPRVLYKNGKPMKCWVHSLEQRPDICIQLYQK